MRLYGSYKKLHGNSRSAMLAAIEIYNKPMMSYRDEVFVILLMNAWELLFKAILSKDKRRIYYEKKRGEAYRTLGWRDAYRAIQREGLWPSAIQPLPVGENLDLLGEYRDHAVHFYNAPGFPLIVFSLAQTSIVNYRDVARAVFSDDLADAITWQLMPLGVRPPLGPIEFLQKAPSGEASPAVTEFLTLLADASSRLEEKKIDTSRLLTVYDVNLQTIKKIEHADFKVGITKDDDGDPRYMNRRVDPTKSHPLLPKDVIAEVGALHGKKFTQFTFTALERHFGWGEADHLCWKDPATNSKRWSREILKLIKATTAAEDAEARANFAAYRQEQKDKNKNAQEK